ncbi:cell wall-binding repeat-containing protein [Intrasporangium calvum]|uniref:Cell wall-binding repeat-containing protein n=1 Tax=Intrasporangium calvum TaxID=53358 RepID=A0ABT5GKY3_9MICO|nr:cell wall-binding repeat-containing protein [Intrasporangium calvum]MDC5698903.1 cell wall-binding repeat-containing protein [Intrasporangium calvum]
MTPSTKRSARVAAVAAAATVLPLLISVTPPASAQDEPGDTSLAAPASSTDATTTSPPPATRVSSHALVAADKVPDAATLDSADAAEAAEHASGKRVTVRAASAAVDLPDLAVVGVTWRAGSAPGASVQYRTLKGSEWSDWEFIEVDPDHAPDDAEAKEAAAKVGGAREGSAPLITTDSDEVQVRLLAADGSSPDDAQLAVIDPGTFDATASETTSTSAAATTESASPTTESTQSSAESTTAVAQPEIRTRAQWGADETLRDPSEPDYGEVEAAIIHHTAGSNDYTQDDVPGIIRGIYAYHVKSKGWRDIGYNFLVDKWGRIWEGRYGGIDKAVIGAHAYGVNSWTMGTSVLGDYDIAPVPDAVSAALRDLIAWKADVHRFDVLGTTTIGGVTYKAISGHRNVNQTECPGDNLYAKLSWLRTETAALSPSATRIGGSDRYAVAAATSAATFAPGAPVAYIATGGTFPDALAAGPAGGFQDGPVLLTKTDLLVSATIDELTRLKPQRIVILGGTASVSTAVEQKLAAYAPTVTRIGGADRYRVAASTSAATFAPGAPVAYIATGGTFPDALAAGPAGGFQGGPVLLTKTDLLVSATIEELTRLKPQQIVVLGGTVSVSAAVEQQLAAYAPSVQRIGGADRYQVAAGTSRATFAVGAPVAYIATGGTFPDALAAGPVGGFQGGPVLLTKTDVLAAPTIEELTRLKPQRIVILGGTASVSEAVAKRLYNYEVPPAA